MMQRKLSLIWGATLGFCALVVLPVMAQANFTIYGDPTGAPTTNLTVDHTIYKLSNDGMTKFATWVAYKLEKDMFTPAGKTKRVWKKDPNIPNGQTLVPSDYQGAHATLDVDRGHQAPLGSFSNTAYWRKTNFLSNITPQKSDLNQGAWLRVEVRVRKLAAEDETVYVMTGPLYGQIWGKLPNASMTHRIPTGYWKIIAIEQEDEDEPILVTGYMFGQDTARSADEDDYRATVNQIEKCTCLDFFPLLDDEIEERVESQNSLELPSMN
ncbi:DNA/RNA non-specific endonuclease [Pseudodesulfovibrio senegalensis]|uniref:Endonuclease n=1 Tax=Pseudodesulfovibrio senegalensis TaxID=1721087 RepID=A0A6N6N583_9BACT|nr:DNA/RNA non-specific endonuclease [Pseudodesulfovibrio senegalensis]KAB1443390.1 DNA/RNA non-specific endonuclease [Pseudodesulfovibrio senegalensis]